MNRHAPGPVLARPGPRGDGLHAAWSVPTLASSLERVPSAEVMHTQRSSGEICTAFLLPRADWMA